MADAPATSATAGGRGQQPTPCFKLFGTRIVTETTGNPTKENEHKSESGIDSPEKPTATVAAGAGGGSVAVASGLACPRCKSRETKFCYFNNYNVNQPRHFCRGCHRYWTAGGALRNVPVGAGRRKAPRPTSQAGEGGVFGLSAGLDGVVVHQWLMSHDGFPAKRPNIGGFHDRIG